MSNVQIFWDPNGFEVDALGPKELLRITDGDTPFLSLSVRMLSIDTPEVHYPGNQKPANQDETLAQLAEWIKGDQAPLEPGLANYLYPRLVTGRAGSLQGEQGEQATRHFQKMLDERLTRPNGSKRQIYLRAADQPFDQYGRILAYIAPYFSSKELATLPPRERMTFNLAMVESGWAAPFPIYPSIPKYSDLTLLQEIGHEAFRSQRGVWAEPATLTGYEFRMVVKLYEVTRKLVAGESLSSRERYSWISRYCVDMTSREIYHPQDYYWVAPYNRIFIWPQDVSAAVGKMNLLPAQPG
jgi:endonuclease YncB( thermonuclease family)